MAQYQNWLLCGLFLLFNFSFTFAQMPSTILSASNSPTANLPSPSPTLGESNGIISDAGAPTQQASISYSIESAPTSPLDAASTAGSVGQATKEHSGQGLALPAILGIALGVALVAIGIMALAVWAYMRRRQQLARMQRKTIMDAEFAQSLHSFPVFEGKATSKVELEKPLPTVEKVSEERLSRSSTIIASDAAEIAQINRKASVHQSKPRTVREKHKDRDQALKILVGNLEDRRASSAEALNSNPTTPKSPCHDNNGDVFQHRPSKI